jgi:6-phosphogluconolactonase
MSARQPIEVFPTTAALAKAAADRVVASAGRAQAKRGTFTIALSGGSTPRALFQLLSTERRIDWSRVQIWFGDERAVGPDHPDSNFHMAHESLLGPLNLPDNQVHRILGEAVDLRAEALRYGQEVKAGIGEADGWPVFDFMLQGIGTDGHTASLFPGTGAVGVVDRVAIHVVQPAYVRPAVERISLTAPVIQAAREIVVLAAGPDKAQVLPEVLDGPLELEKRPSQLIRQAKGQVVWLLDSAAASQLKGV